MVGNKKLASMKRGLGKNLGFGGEGRKNRRQEENDESTKTREREGGREKQTERDWQERKNRDWKGKYFRARAKEQASRKKELSNSERKS